MSSCRYEYKYLLNAKQMVILKMRANGIMQKDIHASTKGSYEIRSLYFDSVDDICLFENENGIDPRSKFRIRIYDADISFISLEKKSKINGMTHKESSRISVEECKKLMNMDITIFDDICKYDSANRQKEALIREMFDRLLVPKVIVSYEREPYVYNVGNVRITFDDNISSSNDVGSFLEKSVGSRLILPIGMSLLEVKWDEVFPIFLRQCMQIETLQWTNFSKYYLCRRYNIDGGLTI